MSVDLVLLPRVAFRGLPIDGPGPGDLLALLAGDLLGDDRMLDRLTEQSLLQITDGPAGLRFTMLETVREFAATQRDDAGETTEVIGLLCDWARTLPLDADATAARPERDNLLQAPRHGLDRADGATVAVTTALLASLWMTESNFDRLGALAAETGWLLSHFRPTGAHVEATRTALVLGAMIGSIMPGLNPARSLVALRRLPHERADTPARALHVVLGTADRRTLSDSDQPLLATFADYLISYERETNGDPDGALVAARRMLGHLASEDLLLLSALAHGRVGELCLQLDPGEPAFHHLDAALAHTRRLGWAMTSRSRWALVVANLQRSAFDQAERNLLATRAGEPAHRFAICARAEIHLGRGETDAGLRLWRDAADGPPSDGDIGLWPFEAEAVAVIRHVQHGRADEIRDVTARLPGILLAAGDSELPARGSLLAAIAAAGSRASVMALALRLGVLRGFHPAMDPDRLRDLTDPDDYRTADAHWARHDRDALIAAVPMVLAQRTGSRRNSTHAHT